MHKLLERQLRRHFGSLDAVPADLQPLLEAVSRNYDEADADRRLVERSLELTSQELMQRNAALRDREREQQIIFDSVPALIFYKDRDNRILRLNATAAKTLGKRPEELQGVACEDIFPPEVAKALHDDDLAVIESDAPKLGILEQHPGPDGRMRWMRTDKVPFHDDSGRVKGVIVLSVDITERRVAEEALRSSEEQYRLIVETATEGIWTIDRQARTTWCNRVMADMLGYQPPELVGRTVFEFMAPSEVAYAQQQLASLLDGGRVSLDFKFRRKDGSDLWTQASAAAMRDPSGHVVGALGMLTDITERKAAEEKLKEAYERLQHVDQERRQFLNNAAHELGTPLTPIKIQVHMLRTRADTLSEEHRKAVEILERNFERLAQLVKDLLDSARLQAVTMKLHSRRIDLRDIVYQAVETYLAPAAAAGVVLDVEELPHLMVDADPGRLGQVFDNLLSNALKFTPRGKAIHVGAHRDGAAAVAFVRDEGRGIRAEDLGRLFKPFSQVHDSADLVGGTGLGLYVSRGIMEALGGTVMAHSEGLGKGSTFTVRLPLVPFARGVSTVAASPERAG